MSLRKPSKRDLVVGKIVDIYDGEGNLKGKARLLQRKPSRSRSEGLPYIRYEKRNDKQDSSCYFWSFERWELVWEEHSYHAKGTVACADVHYYMKMATHVDSMYDITREGHKGLEIEGLLVFLEEDALEIAQDGLYSVESIMALKRIMRASNGIIILYSHSPLQAKERFELSKIPFRIFDFIYTDKTFQEGIEDYLDSIEYEEFIILAGQSKVNLPNVINSPGGLKLKKQDARRRNI